MQPANDGRILESIDYPLARDSTKWDLSIRFIGLSISFGRPIERRNAQGWSAGVSPVFAAGTAELPAKMHHLPDPGSVDKYRKISSFDGSGKVCRAWAYHLWLAVWPGLNNMNKRDRASAVSTKGRNHHDSTAALPRDRIGFGHVPGFGRFGPGGRRGQRQNQENHARQNGVCTYRQGWQGLRVYR